MRTVTNEQVTGVHVLTYLTICIIILDLNVRRTVTNEQVIGVHVLTYPVDLTICTTILMKLIPLKKKLLCMYVYYCFPFLLLLSSPYHLHLT